MKQITKKNKKQKKKVATKPAKKPLVGTSKLEEDFASDFLDKLGVEYVRQFKAEPLQRYYDFYLPKENLLIEIDGGYW